MSLSEFEREVMRRMGLEAGTFQLKMGETVSSATPFFHVIRWQTMFTAHMRLTSNIKASVYKFLFPDVNRKAHFPGLGAVSSHRMYSSIRFPPQICQLIVYYY